MRLMMLKNNKSIVICNPDRGQGVAILNKTNYIIKMEKKTARFSFLFKLFNLIHKKIKFTKEKEANNL